jgi:hypothetical protein
MTSKSVATTRNEGREAYLIYYIQLIKVTVGSIQNILVTINLQIVTLTSSTVLLQNPRPSTMQPEPCRMQLIDVIEAILIASS